MLKRRENGILEQPLQDQTIEAKELGLAAMVACLRATWRIIRDNALGLYDKSNVSLWVVKDDGTASVIQFDTWIPRGSQAREGDIACWNECFVAFEWIWMANGCKHSSGRYYARNGHYFSEIGIEWHAVARPTNPPTPPFEIHNVLSTELPR